MKPQLNLSKFRYFVLTSLSKMLYGPARFKMRQNEKYLHVQENLWSKTRFYHERSEYSPALM